MCAQLSKLSARLIVSRHTHIISESAIFILLSEDPFKINCTSYNSHCSFQLKTRVFDKEGQIFTPRGKYTPRDKLNACKRGLSLHDFLADESVKINCFREIKYRLNPGSIKSVNISHFKYAITAKISNLVMWSQLPSCDRYKQRLCSIEKKSPGII